MNILLRAVMAGIAISCGCICNLAIGGVAGAVLFTFGLLTVVHYQYKLYTGTAGFVTTWRSVGELVVVLAGNIIGCLLCGRGIAYAKPELSAAAANLLAARLNYSLPAAFILAVGCGFIMTTAVYFGRQKMFLPLLFGVPCFIICGFLHSIADACYYLACPVSFLSEHASSVLALYVSIVLGNFVGCNLYRLGELVKAKE
ncbi:MAG: formate/nitrite transporter family protein [Prevotella sp.]|nr:formate/nitrite transporter family protein [Prevotella sp.]